MEGERVTMRLCDVCRLTTGPLTTIGAAPATSGTTSTPATGDAVLAHMHVYRVRKRIWEEVALSALS
jgi:hypothetical protein